MRENLIQRAELMQRLTRGLEIKGVGSPAPTLDSVVVPIVLLDDLTRQNPSTQPTERRAYAFHTELSTVGELSGVALINPVNSGNVMVVDMAFGTDIGGATLIRIGRQSQGTIQSTYAQILSGQDGPQWADERNGNVLLGGGPAGQMWSGSSPTSVILGGQTFFHIRISAAGGWISGYMLPDRAAIVLTEGRCLVIENQTAARAIDVSISWLEFPAAQTGF